MHNRLAAFLVALTLLALPNTMHAQQGQRCFPETGYCIDGRIRAFWEGNGGLPVFGLPITPQQSETIEGRALTVQWFERNRLELHPENPAPNDVLLGRLGADLLSKQGRDWQGFPKSSAQSGCRFFAETGHNICGTLLSRWRASGLELDGRRGISEAESLALWGLPLSDTQTETLSDGKAYQVQWFERGRFELHPENAPPYNVLYGLLGKELGPVASAPPGTAGGQCAAVEQLPTDSPAAAEIAARLIKTLRTNPDLARVEIDTLKGVARQAGWAMIEATFKSDLEQGLFLGRDSAEGFTIVTVWGGIGTPEEVRAYLKEKAPDAPTTLIDCFVSTGFLQ